MYKQPKTPALHEILHAEVIENDVLSFLDPAFVLQFAQTGTVPKIVGCKNLLLRFYKERNHHKQQRLLTALFLQHSDFPIEPEARNLYTQLKKFLVDYACYVDVTLENRLLALANAIIYSYKLSTHPEAGLLNTFHVYLELVKKIKPELVNSILASVTSASHDEDTFIKCQQQHNVLTMFRGGYTLYNRNEMAVILKPFLPYYGKKEYELFFQLSNEREIDTYGSVEVAAQCSVFDIIQVLLKILPDEIVAPIATEFAYKLTKDQHDGSSLADDNTDTTVVCFHKLPEETVIDELDAFSIFIQRVKNDGRQKTKDYQYKIKLIALIGQIGEKTLNINIKKKCLQILQTLLENNVFQNYAIQAMGCVLRHSDAQTACSGVGRLLKHMNSNKVQVTLTAIKKSLAHLPKEALLDIHKMLVDFVENSDITIKKLTCEMMAEIALIFSPQFRRETISFLLCKRDDESIRGHIITAVIRLWLTLPDTSLQDQIYPLITQALQSDSERKTAVKQIKLLMVRLTSGESLGFLDILFALDNIKEIITEDNIQDLVVNLLMEISHTPQFLNRLKVFINLLLDREEPLEEDYNRQATEVLKAPHLFNERAQFLSQLYSLMEHTSVHLQAIAITCITKLVLLPGLALQEQCPDILEMVKAHIDAVDPALKKAAVYANAELFAALHRRTLCEPLLQLTGERYSAASAGALLRVRGNIFELLKSGKQSVAPLGSAEKKENQDSDNNSQRVSYVDMSPQ